MFTWNDRPSIKHETKYHFEIPSVIVINAVTTEENCYGPCEEDVRILVQSLAKIFI